MPWRLIETTVIATSLFLAEKSRAQIAPGGVGSNDGSSSLELWIKADQGLNCSTDGRAITTWNDQSGNNRNLSNAGVASLSLSQLNYNNIIETTSLNRQFTSSSNISGQTVVMVARASGAKGAGGLAGFDGDVGFRGVDVIQHATSGNGNGWTFPGAWRINRVSRSEDHARKVIGGLFPAIRVHIHQLIFSRRI